MSAAFLYVRDPLVWVALIFPGFVGGAVLLVCLDEMEQMWRKDRAARLDGGRE